MASHIKSTQIQLMNEWILPETYIHIHICLWFYIKKKDTKSQSKSTNIYTKVLVSSLCSFTTDWPLQDWYILVIKWFYDTFNHCYHQRQSYISPINIINNHKTFSLLISTWRFRDKQDPEFWRKQYIIVCGFRVL